MLLSKFYNQVICDVTSYYYYQKFELKSLAEIQIIDIYSRLWRMESQLSLASCYKAH